MARKHLIFISFLMVFSSTAIQASVVGISSVIDGDTIEIHRQRIRLNGIDAFESSQSCELNNKIYRCGSRSANYLDQLIAGRTVTCKITGKDRYKRLLGTCFSGNINLNKEMVLAGWALAFSRYSQEYVKDENRARQVKNGAWAGRFANPWDYRANSNAPLSRPFMRTASNQVILDQSPRIRPAIFVYPNCRAVRAARANPIRKGEPGYGLHLDRDNDGIGCE